MAIKRMPISNFVSELAAALQRKDGYIMGAVGQDPKRWKTTSWWFTQYSGSQKEKALYWREHAARVWDCNGLAEGIYKDFAGTDVNTKARYNYSGWCGLKGSGLIPAKRRAPGMAVFWGDRASEIHHVAYLWKPVVSGKPDGDWYLIEARGVAYGVVQTRLNSRKPNFWGRMDKYFDYGDGAEILPTEPALGERILRNGHTGSDVKEMQRNLLALDYDLGKYGADGDFGDATELAVIEFQRDHGCDPDGEHGPVTHAAMMSALLALQPPEKADKVSIQGGQCWVREEPKAVDDNKLGVARQNSTWPYAGETSADGWLKIDFNDHPGWVSGKYGRLVSA